MDLSEYSSDKSTFLYFQQIIRSALADHISRTLQQAVSNHNPLEIVSFGIPVPMHPILFSFVWQRILHVSCSSCKKNNDSINKKGFSQIIW